MRASRTIAGAGATFAALAVGLGLGVGTAAADPSSPPPAPSIVAVGAVTQAGLFDQFSTDYNATSPSYPLYNWSSTGSATFEPKDNAACEDYYRPVSSVDVDDENLPDTAGNSIFAVDTSASFTSGGTTDKCMDLAPAAAPLSADDPTGMVQEVIAEDLLSYSYLPGGNIPANLTPIDLEAIFACNASLINPSYGANPVTEKEIGGTGDDEVMPVIPQWGTSETRETWMSDLGLSNTTIASCVLNGSYTYDGTAYPVWQNESTNPVFNPSDNPDTADVIFPLSAGSYVCYHDTKACGTSNGPGDFVLGDVDGDAPLTGTAPHQTINAAGFYENYDYGLYVDFVGTGAEPYIPSYLQPLLGVGTRGSGWICASGGTGQADIAEYGFMSSKNCGTTSLTPTS